MKLTVSKYLNARSGKPSTVSLCPSYKSPGDVLEIDDVTAGEEIDGNAVWYHCNDDGCFYWSGGIAETEFEMHDQALSKLDEKSQAVWMKALQNDKEWLLSKKIDGYMGCAIGFKNDDPLKPVALVIYVDKKRPNPVYQLPAFVSYKGVSIPTDIKELVVAKHQYKPGGLIPNMLLDNDTPLQMGGSISPSTLAEIGTRGLKLKKGGKSYVLSCFHVLLHDLKSQGFYDGKDEQRRALYPSPNSNTQNLRIRNPKITEGVYNEFYDFAVALLEKEGSDIVNSFNDQRFNGFYNESEMPALKGKTVSMVGTSSFLQKGVVFDYNAQIPIEGNAFSFQNVVVSEKISTAGDSGAPVIDDENKIVGIVIGGNNENKTFILPVYNLVIKKDFFIDFLNN